ncbi:MAG: NUDIX hydrolase [Opitutales bacterium]
MSAALPFKISVLVFLRDAAGRLLMIRRNKAPNLGCWSPVGGKLETAVGESPFECAVRETAEETGFQVTTGDLHLFGMISERGYEGQSHWLMFLFDCSKPVPGVPPDIDEGAFGLFTRAEVDALAVPASDRTLIWPVYDRHRGGFIAYRAECHPDAPLTMTVEETRPGDGG